jgi:glycosyltransferase involved in cell wall biosynthesis
MSYARQNSAPRVSVVMSCFNAAPWIREAIESILKQSFGGFEFVIINDGSTDNSPEIIAEYALLDRRVRLFNKPNTGLSSSLNFGISHAKGELIARQDADDVSERTRLEEQVSFMDRHPDVVLAGTGFLEIDEFGQAIATHIYPKVHRKLIWCLERSKGFFPHSSAIFRRTAVCAVGGYNERFFNTDDRRLWLNLSLVGSLGCIPLSLVRIRKHTSQISNVDGGRRQHSGAVTATICHLLKKQGLPDPSTSYPDHEWHEFTRWVVARMEEVSAFEHRLAWRRARALYFGANTRRVGLLRFVGSLIQSGYAARLITQKFLGDTLYKKLARDWILRSRRNS